MQMSGPLPPNWSGTGARGEVLGRAILVITKRQPVGAFYGDRPGSAPAKDAAWARSSWAALPTNFGGRVDRAGRLRTRLPACIFAEDAMSSLTVEDDEFVIKNVFPRAL